MFDQSRIGHRMRGGQHFFLIDRAGEAIPTVPAQWRREANLVADFNRQRFAVGPFGIRRGERYFEIARLRDFACDLSGFRVER